MTERSFTPNGETISGRRFSRAWASGLLLLIGVSWRLWFPNAKDSYPSVPLLPITETMLPAILQFGSICSFVLVACLAWIALGKEFHKAWIVSSLMLLICFLSDQHRIQPWAYQSFFYGIMFGLIPIESWKHWMRPFIVSIYAYSALGKFDAQFLNTVGNDFVEVVITKLPSIVAESAQNHQVTISTILPITELLVAGSLCIVTLRIYGSMAAIAMHLSLIAILGPWAKNHSWGVLIWNALLIAQHLYLISACIHAPRSQTSSPSPQGVSSNTKRREVIIGLLWIIAISAPTMERQGYWDHWTSWSLYSPHTSRAKIELHQSVVGNLDHFQRISLMPDNDFDQWQEINLSEWSLSTRGVPVYPQARYQLELAAIIASGLSDTHGVRVKLQSVSDRRTGRRREELLFNLHEINQARRQFWLHPKPGI